MILGRGPELAKIDAFLSELRSGAGDVLVVMGEPGIGKTTLLEWTAAAAEGFTVLRANGRETEASLPFVALTDLLRPLQDRIDSLSAPQAAALGSALALAPPTASDRMVINSAAASLLGEVGQGTPLLLLVDDYQWIDSASRDVIDFVARRTPPPGHGMLITTRQAMPADYHGSEMPLLPLSNEIAYEIVARRGGTSPEVMRKIVSLAVGNPLALVELPLDAGQYANDQSSASLQISDAIGRAYHARLDGLPADAQEALLVAAVETGGSFANVLKGLTEIGLAQSAIEPAMEDDLLLVQGSDFRFRHPLVRSVVIGSAPASDVRRIHRALASVVMDEDQRAWHLAAAAVGPVEDVAKALEEAGQRALERGAAATAAEALERAANLSEFDDVKARRLAGAVRAAHRAGKMNLTSRLLGLARVDNTMLDPALLLLDADIRMRRGDFAGAYGALRLEASRIAESDSYRAAMMLLLAAKYRVYRFEANDGLREVEQALALVPTSKRDVVHLAALGMTRTMAGHVEARDTVLAALDAALASVHGHTHTLGIGWPLIWLDEYERAEAFINRSVSIQRNGGYLAYLPQALVALAELCFRTGRWESARAHAEEAYRLFVEDQQPTEAAIASAMLAKLEAVSGNDEAAWRHARAATTSDVGSGLKAATAFADAAVGLLALGRSRYSDAVGLLSRSQKVAESGGIGEPSLLHAEPDLAEALMRSGEGVAGQAVADRLVQHGKTLGRKSIVAAGLRCLAMAASTDSSSALFEEALALHEEMSMPFETARTELCYGERLRRDRQRLAARNHLRIALVTFEALGAQPWIGRASTELGASGERLQRRDPVTSLTPQERQVANLVREGATNREAAEILFVSTKTIEFHLGNVYRKLGIRSRTELAIASTQASTGDHEMRTDPG